MAVIVGYGTVLALGTIVTSYPQILTQRFVLGYFTGSMYPITVGIYVGLFSTEVRGRAASVIIGSSYLAVALLGAATTLIFEFELHSPLLLWPGAAPVAPAFLPPLALPHARKTLPFARATPSHPPTATFPPPALFPPRPQPPAPTPPQHPPR